MAVNYVTFGFVNDINNHRADKNITNSWLHCAIIKELNQRTGPGTTGFFGST